MSTNNTRNMKNNNANITGDKNTVIQNSKKSTININSKSTAKSKRTLWTTVIAIIGVLVAIIVGWNEIINFFN